MLVAERLVRCRRSDRGCELEQVGIAGGRVIAVLIVEATGCDGHGPVGRVGHGDAIAEGDLAPAAVEHVGERVVAPGEEVAVDERALPDRNRAATPDRQRQQRQTVGGERSRVLDVLPGDQPAAVGREAVQIRRGDLRFRQVEDLPPLSAR